jgi:glycosyltransferase involved in cell wall biosynthesis
MQTVNTAFPAGAQEKKEQPKPVRTASPCVNLRTLGYGITGVQRYLLCLLPHMPRELNSIKPSAALQGIKGHLWEQFYLPTQLKRRLLWSPGNTGPLSIGQQVLTLHDAASLDHPEWFARRFALWYNALLPRLVRKVRTVITVSNFSKERIVGLTGVEPDRVHVIPNGVEPRFRPADPSHVRQVRRKFELGHPYILFVGSLEPRKNLKILLEAWGLGRFDGATLAVVGAGGHLFAKTQLGSMAEGVRLLGRVEDEVLPALYSGAAGFVYPSIYEGFGLPPLEAMACGTPIAVSDIPVHREVFGNRAIYFDPFNPQELSESLDLLLRLEGSSRASCAASGLHHATSYSWERAAAGTWQILELATS